MKLPRDVDGRVLAHRLAIYGYVISRQTGSHIRLSSTFKGEQHHITIPAHTPLKAGTLSAVLKDVARYLDVPLPELVEALFR